MKKEFKNLFVVNFYCYNRVCSVLFASSLESAKKMVSNITADLQEVGSPTEDVSSIEIIDLSQGFFHSERPDAELTKMLMAGRLSRVMHVEQDKLLPGSESIEDGVYYLPSNVNVAERYQYDAESLEDAILRAM